jgi:predicted metal-dependent hydrolase
LSGESPGRLSRSSRLENAIFDGYFFIIKEHLTDPASYATMSALLLTPGALVLGVRPGTSEEKRQAIIAGWYRRQLKEAATGLIARWEAILGVQAGRVFVQRMKTRWGSCNPDSRAIRLNTELAKKPVQCLEYIVAHELTHLLERHHNARFKTLLDAHLPQWPQYRDLLNRLPLAHEAWGY